MVARAFMIQGTGSDVGKSVIVAGLCRLARRRGIDVAPFKPQNMSNNAAVTPDGGEIGRAQALQALAAGIEISVDLNPVLIKPESDRRSQVVVHGQVIGRQDAAHWIGRRGALLEPVLHSLERLRAKHQLIIVEGAGSPAEVNLRRGDIANMGFARAADVPVCLLGDIDRGGVIAAVVGTRHVLDAADAAMIEGFAINRFRGDPRLFDDGVIAIERASGWPCFGVVPWLHEAARLPAEDAVSAAQQAGHAPYTRQIDRGMSPGTGMNTGTDTGQPRRLRISAPMLSRIANFDDADPLRQEPAVDFNFIPPGQPIPRQTDIILLFGTKSTRADMAFIERQGWHHDIHAHVRTGGAVLGLCGGYQLLGEYIDDADGHDGTAGRTPGLGLLSVRTRMSAHKILRRVHGRCALTDVSASGYEIHVGDTQGEDRERPMLLIDGNPEGARSADGRIEGSYVHGLFSDDDYRRRWLARHELGSRDASDGVASGYAAGVQAALDGIADRLEAALDIDRLFAMAR